MDQILIQIVADDRSVVSLEYMAVQLGALERGVMWAVVQMMAEEGKDHLLNRPDGFVDGVL